MQRLGTAAGITQQFLLLCGLSTDCTRKDLLQALLWPYMKRKGIRRRFLANADWTAPILGDKALPAFRFGCMPQTSTSTTNPAGLEVVLATDVVWLIISQGLFAAEWAVTAHGHSVVVHLRNLASATLAMLAILIHTKIEKAAIPANNGHLVLSQPSPVMRDDYAPAAVPFDERLHTDSFRLDNSRNNANMLCCQMRRHPAQFRCIKLADKSTVLYYESILRCRQSTWLPQCKGELFPFPPESMYHMQAHQQMMSKAYQRLLAECPGLSAGRNHHESCQLALALRIYGLSVEEEMVTHIPATLTHCVVRNGNEFPCMTYKHGFVFTLKVGPEETLDDRAQPTSQAQKGRGALLLTPVKMTHHWDLDMNRHLGVPHDGQHDGQRGMGDWRPLPVQGVSSLGLDELSFAMSSSLHFDGETVVVRRPADLLAETSEDMEVLPFLPFPVIKWKTVLLLNLTHEEVEVSVDRGGVENGMDHSMEQGHSMESHHCMQGDQRMESESCECMGGNQRMESESDECMVETEKLDA